MCHQCIDRTDRRVLNVVLVNEAVAVSDPLFAVDRVVTSFAVVIFLTPSSISDLVPERRCPSTYSSVEEDIFAEFFANVAFEADDTFSIFVTYVACIRTCSRELSRDTVELEEAIVTLVLHEVVSSIFEYLIVSRVRQLHTTLAAPVVAAIVTTSTVTTYRTEPCTYASTHLLSRSSDVAHFIGESAVECPSTVVVPTVVDDECSRTFAVLVEEVGLPVIQYVEHLVSVHVFSRIGSIVAVDVQFVPRDVAWESTPGHCTFAF